MKAMAWSINQLEDRNSYGLVYQPIFRTGTAMTWSINQLEDRDSHGLIYQPITVEDCPQIVKLAGQLAA